MNRFSFSDERGQAMAFSAMMLVALIGMTAFVVDVGAWFRADRHAQSVADASALAGAQLLPHDPSKAATVALDYATKNEGSGTVKELVVFKDRATNDSIRVRVSSETPGFFARVFSVNSVTVGAEATARASTPASAKWVAPIAVSEKHPMLGCTAPGKCNPSFGTSTDISLVDLHSPGGPDAAGAFGLINLTGSATGTIGNSELAGWLDKGYDDYVAPGIYYSVPSSMFNSSDFQAALADKISAGDEILLPVYRRLVKMGSNAEYTIVGFVSFVITSVSGSGSSQKLHGYFTQITWEGIPSTAATETPNYGTVTVSLTK